MRFSWLPAVLLIGMFGCKTADTVSSVKNAGDAVGNNAGQAIRCAFPAMQVADGSQVQQPYPAGYPAGFVGHTGTNLGSGQPVTLIELDGVTPGSPDGRLQVDDCAGPVVDVVGEVCAVAEFVDPDTNQVTRKRVLVESSPNEPGSCYSRRNLAVHGDCFDCDAWCKQEKGEFLVGSCQTQTSDLTRLIPRDKNLTATMQEKVRSVPSASCVCDTSDGAGSIPVDYGDGGDVELLPPPPGDSGGPHIVPMDGARDGATDDRYDSAPRRDDGPSELKTLPASEYGNRRVL